MTDTALAALAWISAEGQRDCQRIPWHPCPDAAPDKPDDWCDVCVAGAAYWTATTNPPGQGATP